MEKISKGDLQKKLEYLNLDLDDIPGELIDYSPLNFNVSRLNKWRVPVQNTPSKEESSKLVTLAGISIFIKLQP